MGDGIDPVSTASGPDSGLRAVRGEKESVLVKPASLFRSRCFNKKVITDYQEIISNKSPASSLNVIHKYIHTYP